MAARSTQVKLTNQAGRFNLIKTSQSLEHGEFTTEPPAIIGNEGDWRSESDGFATGTEGHVHYRIETDEGEPIGTLNLHWDNPFIGSNSYDQSVSPQATDGGDGFSVGHLGGDGNDASVEFLLLGGDCTFDEDTGEFFCTSSQPLTPSVAASQRYAGIWRKDAGPSFHAHHGMTAEQYQQTFDQMVAQGFRPVVVSGDEANGADAFAAIFEKRDGPAFAARHGLTSDQYQQAFDELTGQGFRPINVSGYTLNGEARYAAIFEQRDGPAFAARHGLTAAQYQQTFDELTGQGFRPRDVSGFGLGGEAHFAAIFEQDGGPAFAARHGLSADQYQQAFDELTGQGMVPTVVSGYNVGGQDQFAAIFEQQSGVPFAARHGLDPAGYQQAFDELVGQGFRLTWVSGYTVG
jgi:hypothetical protein